MAPPSVVLIVIDTLRKDHLSLYGYLKPTSPGLEQLAKEAVTFENCLATSSWTKPSTLSLLTGLYRTGNYTKKERKASPQLEFLAEALSAEGYATGAISGNPWVSATYGLDQGFAHFQFDGGKLARYYPDSNVLLQAARTWLDETLEQPKRQPFFLYIHLMNVHGPYRSPDHYRTRFAEEPNEELVYRGPVWQAAKREGKAKKPLTEGHLNDLRAVYDAAIAYTDDQIFAFVQELRRRGILDNSVLLITADHGEELYDHEDLGHRSTLHGELLNVPLLLRLPGGRHGGLRVRAAVSLVDVPATILDAAGLLNEQREGRFGDGVSLLGKLRAPTDAMERPLLAELLGSGRALVQRWPYRMERRMDEARDPRSEANVFRLYNVERDPGEQRDIAAQNPAVIDELKLLLEQLQNSNRQRLPEGEEIEPNSQIREQLEALGYLE